MVHPISILPYSLSVLSPYAIAADKINVNALTVLSRLQESGYDAYLVGGCVRDLLLGYLPKDFDIATSAHPEEIKRLFRNCRLIGKRFRLAHIYFGKEIIEVATFRANSAVVDPTHRSHSESGMILRDNVYGTLEEDAWRRDFTINALYFDTNTQKIIDFAEGLPDLQNKTLRLIGSPTTRYREDPVRMLRAIRFAAKLGLTLDPATEKPLFELHELICAVSPARLFEETLKLFHSGHATKVFELLRHYHLLHHLFPLLIQSLETNEATTLALLNTAFANTDLRIQQGKSVTPAFLFAVLLWFPLQQMIVSLQKSEPHLTLHEIYDMMTTDILQQQTRLITIPRTLTAAMREIWKLQLRLSRNQGKKIWRVYYHPRFRAAYDFLALRAINDPTLEPLVAWWRNFQEVDDKTREQLVKATMRRTKSHATKADKKNDE